MFLVIAMPVLAQNNKKPFSLELIQQPSALKIGQTNKFVFIVRNASRMPITLSSICAAKAGSSWKRGARRKGFMSRAVIILG
jgi:cytochrome c oxidase assembly protein Cox11